MPALSPPASQPASRISPRPKPPKAQPKANSNPFASLSPDLPENILSAGNITQNLTSEPSPTKPGNIRYYTRETLLVLAKKCKKRGWEVPADLAPFESWFGKVSTPTKPEMVDPAIASIGQPGGNGRRGQGGPGGNTSSGSNGGGGGFGEGFGFGGGIGGGGRGIGRGGGRNIGLRRQNNDPAPEGTQTIQQQMNKLASRSNGRNQPGDNPNQNHGQNQNQNQNQNRQGDRGQSYRMENNGNNRNEWRRDNYNHAGSRIHHDDEAEPAWMDDAAPEPESTFDFDPAIIHAADPLIHFIPGEDMIAKHKQSMKERDLGGRWRFDATMPDAAALDSKPKVFNNADYLRPNKVIQEAPDVVELAQPEAPSTAFASRFQRFFAAETQQQQQAPSPPQQQIHQQQQQLHHQQQPRQEAPPPPPPSAPPPKPDDHASRLMGLLSLSEQPSRESPHQSHNMPHHPSHQMGRPMISPPPFLPPPMHHPQQYDHNTPHALLQQLYAGGPGPRPQQLPPHMMLPPQPPAGYGAPPPPSYGRPPFPPQFYGPGPPPYPQQQSQQHQQIPPPHVLHPHPGPPGLHRPQPPSADRKQDILNTLFAGLGPGR